MTKQEIIQEYYGEDYLKAIRSDYGIDSDGFSDFYAHGNETHLNGYEIYAGHSVEDTVRVRPLGLGKALEDLKNNNQWIKVEKESDLPDEEGQYFVYSEHKNNPYYKYRIDVFSGRLSNTWQDGKPVFSHYQKINKPKPPLS